MGNAYKEKSGRIAPACHGQAPPPRYLHSIQMGSLAMLHSIQCDLEEDQEASYTLGRQRSKCIHLSRHCRTALCQQVGRTAPAHHDHNFNMFLGQCFTAIIVFPLYADAKGSVMALTLVSSTTNMKLMLARKVRADGRAACIKCERLFAPITPAQVSLWNNEGHAWPKEL